MAQNHRPEETEYRPLSRDVMNTKKTQRDRYEVSILALAGLCALFISALHISTCMIAQVRLADTLFGAVILVGISLVPYFVLDKMICSKDRSFRQKRVILAGAVMISIPAWGAYYMTYAHPDAQGGLVPVFVVAMQLIGCGVLAVIVNLTKSKIHNNAIHQP